MDLPDRDELIREHERTAARYAKAWLRDHPGALGWGQGADFGQEAWLALRRAALTFDPSRGAKFTTYLRRVVWTALNDLLRRRRPSAGLPAFALERAAPERPDWSEEVALLRRALRGLPPRERESLACVYGLGGRKAACCAAVARRLGRNRTAVSNACERGRRRLRALLAGCAGGVRG
jgi:RNA polymerase sigma factor (sigma-70 family)